MRIDGFKQPKSSFLSVEKDTSIIINSMLKADGFDDTELKTKKEDKNESTGNRRASRRY